MGNIPYAATEDDVRPILQSIGIVINLEYKLFVFLKVD